MKIFNRLLVVFVLFAWSCSEKNPDPEYVSSGKLVNVHHAGSFSKEQLNASLASLAGGVNMAFLIENDVNYYRVFYKTTTTDGKEVTASGALILPNITNDRPLVSIQHGTIFNEVDAPSFFKIGTESSLGLLTASRGFIVAMPDYVGYGESNIEPHPYEHAKGLAVANADFLLAIKDYLIQEKEHWNKDIFIAGYSAGGYATLATQKYIEENYAKELNVKLSVCGAGAYSKSNMLSSLVNETSVGEVSHNKSYIWVLQTYDRIYNFNRPAAYYFKEPYASEINKNGHNVNLVGSFNSLLNPDFIKSYNEGKEEKFAAALKENDLTSWKTNIETVLIHGDADTYVPYENATIALEGMKKAGSSKVSLVTIQGGKHDTAVMPFMLQTLALIINRAGI